MRRLAFLFLVTSACAHESGPDPAPKPAPAPGVAFAQPPNQPAKVTAKVELTAVTLADDCGGAPPSGQPARAAVSTQPSLRAEAEDPTAKGKAKADAKGEIAYRRRCEQTSMQLAIVATDAAKIQIKSVELLDESGASLGMLTASKPTRWSDATSTYETWDESFAAGSTSNVSYVLSQPDWDRIGNRWNRTFTVKTVVSVGGAEQTTQKSVTVQAQATLPPNVKT